MPASSRMAGFAESFTPKYGRVPRAHSAPYVLYRVTVHLFAPLEDI